MSLFTILLQYIENDRSYNIAIFQIYIDEYVSLVTTAFVLRNIQIDTFREELYVNFRTKYHYCIVRMMTINHLYLLIYNVSVVQLSFSSTCYLSVCQLMSGTIWSSSNFYKSPDTLLNIQIHRISFYNHTMINCY